MRKLLAKVDDGRLGRAVAGLVTQTLVVQEIARREKEICALVVSRGKTGTREFGGQYLGPAAAQPAPPVALGSFSGGPAVAGRWGAGCCPQDKSLLHPYEIEVDIRGLRL